ncbi:hypothetical protein JCM24511_07552 [Saitozyma sp. JCM 24511]|nr:hypothetical protein JCM24511_07552 [Saitozyma sp. JCM 24511]
MEEAGPSATPPKRRRPRMLGLGLNTWAVRSWPPNSNLTMPCTPQQFLQYTHYRLALSDAPRPQLAEMLDALESCLPAHEPQDALDVLHLFLAYPSRPARAPSGMSPNSPPTGQRGRHDLPRNCEAFSLSLLDQFVARYPAISPTRQTLHLIITSCLRSHRTSPPSDVNESVTQTSAGVPIDSTDPLVIIRDFASRWTITPGLATLRHLLRYAVRKDVVNLAEYAWHAWSAESARLQGIRDREEATGSASPSSDSSTHTNTRPKATAQSASDAVPSEVEARTAVGRTRVRFRFRRLGREGWRWGRALRSAEKRGWVRKDEEERHGWAWVGAVPSEAAATATTATTTVTATAMSSGTPLSEEDAEVDSVV